MCIFGKDLKLPRVCVCVCVNKVCVLQWIADLSTVHTCLTL